MKHGKLSEKELHTGRRVWMLIPEEGYLDQVTITRASYNCGFDLDPDVGVKYVDKFIGISFCGNKIDIPLCLLNRGFMMFRTEVKGVKWMKKFSITRRCVVSHRGSIGEIDSDVFSMPVHKEMTGAPLSTDPFKGSIDSIDDYGFEDVENIDVTAIEAAYFTDRIKCMFRRHAAFVARRGAEHIRKVQSRKKVVATPLVTMSNPSAEVRYTGQ